MSDAYTDLVAKIKTLSNTVKGLQDDIRRIDGTLDIVARKSDLETEAIRLRSDLSNISSVVTTLNDKLNKITLPDDTRYYMGEEELRNLRNKIRQMNSLIVKLEDLEKTIVQTLNRSILNLDLS